MNLLDQIEILQPIPAFQNLQHRYRGFLENRRAAGVVFAVVTMMVMLLIATIIVVYITNSIQPDENWTDQANNTYDSLVRNIWIALGLLAIGIIVAAAYSIVAFVGGVGPRES